MKLTTHERAKVAASARWSGKRQPWVRISIDADAAELLSQFPKGKQRKVASDAIRHALGEETKYFS